MSMEYGLIGARLGHSFSPAIHQALGGYDYRLTELDKRFITELTRSKRACITEKK